VIWGYTRIVSGIGGRIPSRSQHHRISGNYLGPDDVVLDLGRLSVCVFNIYGSNWIFGSKWENALRDSRVVVHLLHKLGMSEEILSIRISFTAVLFWLTAISFISSTQIVFCPSPQEAQHIKMARAEAASQSLIAQYWDNPQSRFIHTYLGHGRQLFEPESY